MFSTREREILIAALEIMYGESVDTVDAGESVPPYSPDEITSTIQKLEAMP